VRRRPSRRSITRSCVGGHSAGTFGGRDAPISSAVSRPRARDAKRSSGFRDARPSERRTTSR
jgi:hypothetical protein